MMFLLECERGSGLARGLNRSDESDQPSTVRQIGTALSTFPTEFMRKVNESDAAASDGKIWVETG